MSDKEYIQALERNVREANNFNRQLRAALAKATQRNEQLRQLLCAVASNTNKAQRIIAGEEE